jgi:hypothetical protein
LNKVTSNFNDAAFKMEQQIREDKIKQGIDGIEWLVINTIIKDTDIRSLEQWLMYVSQVIKNNPEEVMKDALRMNHKKFYRKYKINWWISIDDSITYLILLKERDYKRYFEFIKSIK